LRVSVTCIIFFRFGRRRTVPTLSSTSRGRTPRVSKNPRCSAWCGRRDSNPHNFRHWNLNPARLPVPPRPLRSASSPAAMPEHDAEKCEAVFGRPSCSKLMELIGFVTWRSQITNPIVAAAYNMGLCVRSKKMPHLGRFETARPAGHLTSKMVRIGFMARRFLRMDRRALMAGFGATSLGLLLPGRSAAQGYRPVAIQARRDALKLLQAGPETPVWMLAAPELRFRQGDGLQVEFANELTVPVGLDWRGIDGLPAIELLISRRLLAAAGWEKIQIPLRH